MKDSLLVLAAAGAFLGAGACRAADFTFGFEGFPSQIHGVPGTEVTFDGYLTLTSAGIPIETDPTLQEGVQGWSYGLEVTGATIDASSTFDPITPQPDTPEPPDTKGLDLPVATIRAGVPVTMTALWKAGFSLLEAAYADGAPHAGEPIGAVSAIVLNQTKKQVLVPNTTTRIARITLKAVYPEVPAAIHLEFKPGLSGSGEPVGNVVTYLSQSSAPVNGALDIPFGVCGPEFILALVEKDVLDVGGYGSGYNRMEVMAYPNTAAEFYVDVLLETRLCSIGDGPQGWSFGFKHTPNIQADPSEFAFVGEDGDIPACLQGVIVHTLRGDPGVAVDLDLAKAGFKVAEPAYADKAPHFGDPVGVVTAIVLNQTKKQVLVANSTQKVLRIKFKAQVGDVPFEATLDFQAGLFGSGEPVSNVITYQSVSQTPTITRGLKVVFHGPFVDPEMFVRGDANNDGRVDIADAIYIVYCSVPGLGDGYWLGCPDAGDANADLAVNLADASFLIQYLFLGGMVPEAPFPDCWIAESTMGPCPVGTGTCTTFP